MDRWGAYIDFWEFLNEQKVADRWYEIMIPYLRSIDPYHPVPWDAFPLDPNEWRDTDGDGGGDDDGDGRSDAEEKKAGTDPLNRLNFPLE